jgi:hypothetical protein
MTDKKVTPQIKKKTMNPVMAAMAGAVAAGVAVAGAMIMSDKKNQDKVKKVVSDVKDNLKKKKTAIVNKAKKLEDITKDTGIKVKKV